MLEVRNLKKSFNGQEVLRGLNVTFDRDCITVIIGGSGQGKSVFLKHLVGLIKPDSGEILLGGKNICSLERLELREVRKSFGLLFQDAALFDSMNVFENIAFPLIEHTDLKNNEIKRIVEEKLQQIRLPGIEEKMPNELSGGMRKRVGLARAIALDPEIILYDEPTTGLDPITTKAIDDLIVETQNNLKGASIIISHDIPSTLRIANKIAMLHDGKIVAEGTPKEMINSSNKVVQDFLRPVLDRKGWI